MQQASCPHHGLLQQPSLCAKKSTLRDTNSKKKQNSDCFQTTVYSKLTEVNYRNWLQLLLSMKQPILLVCIPSKAGTPVAAQTTDCMQSVHITLCLKRCAYIIYELVPKQVVGNQRSVLIEMTVSLGNLFSNKTMPLHAITEPFSALKKGQVSLIVSFPLQILESRVGRANGQNAVLLKTMTTNKTKHIFCISEIN